MRFKIKVVPNSSRDEICGYLGDALKIKVRAAPESGRANKAVLKLLAVKLELYRDQLIILSGHSQARKVVELRGVDESYLRDFLF